MLSPDFLQYLHELSQNNNRDWFEKQKKRYEASVKKPFEATVGAIIEALKILEPEFQIQPKDCIHRIYRDVRFSKDKTPYKTHVSAVLTEKGRHSIEKPGYYLHIEFGSLMLGGGAYFLDKAPLHKLRTAIMQDPDSFRQLLADKQFVEIFGDIKGEKNKVLPAEFKEAAKSNPLLFNKQFYYMAELDPQICLRPDFVDYAMHCFRVAKPLNDYFKAIIA